MFICCHLIKVFVIFFLSLVLFISNFVGNSTMVLKARRMGACTPQPPAMTVVKAEELASALAATPTTLLPRAAATSSPTGSFHNHSLRSNIIGKINGSRYYSQNHTYSKSTKRILIDNANKTHS